MSFYANKKISDPVLATLAYRLLALFVVVLFAFSFVYFLAKNRQMSDTLPPVLISDTANLQAYINDNNNFVAVPDNDGGSCQNAVNFQDGQHPYYVTKDMTMKDILDSIAMDGDNGVSLAYYNLGSGWYMYPTGRQIALFNDVLNSLGEQDLEDFVIPAYHVFMFTAKDIGKFCDMGGIVMTEDDYLTDQHELVFTDKLNGWVLLPASEDVDEFVANSSNPEMVDSIWYYLPGTNAVVKREKGRDKPADASSIVWLKLSADSGIFSVFDEPPVIGSNDFVKGDVQFRIEIRP